MAKAARAEARHCIQHTHSELPLSVELCLDYKAISCKDPRNNVYSIGSLIPMPLLWITD